jgi:hypothetical protein
VLAALLGVAARAAGRQAVAARLLLAEHAGFALTLVSGVLLMRGHGWALTHARWLGAKVSLVGFLFVPLVAMHAWIAHVWIAPGQREAASADAAKKSRRGLAIEQMLRTLELVLLVPGLLLIVWLSLRKPF